MSKWNLIINVGRCENCHNCVIADRDEHVGNDFPGYAAPAAAVGDSPIRILRRAQGSAPMVETTYLPVMCNHCDDAPCIRYAGDAIRKRDDGIVIIDPVKARGRKDIVGSCPYGAIVWNDEQQVPQTWIFDAHLLDQGWQRPRCQQACPTDVFEAVKLDDAAMEEKADNGRAQGAQARPRDQAPRLVPGAGTVGDMLRRRQRQRRHRRGGGMHRRGGGHPVPGRQGSREDGHRRLRRLSLRQSGRGWRHVSCRSVPCPWQRLARLRPVRERLSGRTEVESIRRTEGRCRTDDYLDLPQD